MIEFDNNYIDIIINMEVDRDFGKDQIYYNIEIGGTPDITPAKFSINRVDEILHNPRDWTINVESFRVPLYSVPLFQFLLADRFKVTLEYNGSSVTKTLQYIPSGSGAAPINFGPVYSYRQQIQSYNFALLDAYNDLKVLEPLMPATKPPYVTLKGNLLSLNAEVAYESNLPNPINIFFNKAAEEQFTSFPTFFETADRIRYLIINQYNNLSGGIYTMTQSSEGISTWAKLNRILFETSTIPIDKQLVGSQNDIQIQIIEDYIVNQEPNRPLDLVFYPQGPLRINTLTSNFPLTSIDVNIRWLSDDNDSQIILLPSNTKASIKLRFTKRTTLDLQNIENQGVNYA
jgi:hypothetical protein